MLLVEQPVAAQIYVCVCGAMLRGIRSSIKVRDFQCSGFWPFMIAHFNTTASAFHNWFRWIWMRSVGWWVGFCHFLAIAQITLSSVSLYLAVSEADCLCTLLHKTSLAPLNAVYDSKKCLYFFKYKLSLIFGVILYFYYWYFMSSWIQTGVLHCKFTQLCVAELSVPVHHTHIKTVLYSAIFLVDKLQYSPWKFVAKLTVL